MQSTQSAFFWLESAWNPETDYEHGYFIPLLSLYMLYRTWIRCSTCRKAPSLAGLSLLGLGAFIFLLALRSQQARLAIAALPFFALGLIWTYWGGLIARRSFIPCLFLWMSIPLPGLQQASQCLQQLSTDLAQFFAQLAAVNTHAVGTVVSSCAGKWDTFSVDGGCSGIRSLMALSMISIAWGYLSFDFNLWKRLCLAAAALPIAIIANGLRIASIFILAEYVQPEFAVTTWHDWSSLLLFFPASIVGLIGLHRLFSFKKKRLIITSPSAPQSNPSDKT